VKLLSEPDSFPIGVRAPATMTEPDIFRFYGASCRNDQPKGFPAAARAGPTQAVTGRRYPGGMPLTEVDHVAIAVRDLDAAIKWYEEAFDATVAHRELVERDGVEEALLAVADSYIQLLTPSREDSTVAKFLETRGEGIHHVGYRVTDCAAALQEVVATGARAIDAEPRPGSRGTTVAFLHPKTAFGTLIELVQE
jgi:methylmalonyl-CoA/ethylmalonyl-CoA epimerase